MNRQGMQKMLDTVNKWQEQIGNAIDKKQDALDTAESADSPNQDRIDKLTDEIESLETILDQLTQLEEEVSNYIEM